METESVIRKFQTIDGNVTRMKVVTVSCAVVAAVVVLGSLFFSYRYVQQMSERIYVIDQGKSLIALQSNDKATKEQECKNHLRTFHEYFFTLAPNQEAISSNMEHAYMLCDGSARDYYNDLAENNYFNRLIANNMIQYIEVDSSIVNTKKYPYEAVTYSTLKIQRATAVTEYSLVTACVMVDMQRSEQNLNGLLMERFTVLERKIKKQL